MYIAKEEIAEKLKKMQSVARDGTDPGKQGVLVKEGALFAYGRNMSMQAKLSVKSGQTFVLPPKAIEQIESLPEGMLTITGSEKQVRIETAGIKNTFQTFSPETYPQEKHAECGEEIVLPMERLQGALRCAAGCAMRDQAKPLYWAYCLKQRTAVLPDCDGCGCTLLGENRLYGQGLCVQSSQEDRGKAAGDRERRGTADCAPGGKSGFFHRRLQNFQLSAGRRGVVCPI